MSISESLPYRSPISKLLRFFCRSRDKWKAKCKAAKGENKSLKYRLAKMTESRDRWKAQARMRGKISQVETVSAEKETIKNPAQRRPRRRLSARATWRRCGQMTWRFHCPAAVPAGRGGGQSGVGTLHRHAIAARGGGAEDALELV